jgi:adenosine deaminase
VRELLSYLANIFSEQKIYGVEFRQKFDISKGESSKAKVIREAFKNKNIFTSFILPGRKTKLNNGLEATMKQINQINETDVSGVDFVGYEDDPFTGARNFFPNVVQKIFENGNKQNLNVINNYTKNDNNTNNNNPNETNSDKKTNLDLFELFFNSLKSGKRLYMHAGETLYFPNYSIDEEFMKEFYINDNLIHAALLPNVERLGHGFAVINNDLLLSIFKRKKIGLEICPISNQLLYYYNVAENPFLMLLRKGIQVSISPDDPGFFGYTGVAMDWFLIMMQTDIKLSEIYLLLKNSILKASPSIYKEKDYLINKLQKDLTEFIEKFRCKDTDTSVLNLNQDELDRRFSLKLTREQRLSNLVKEIFKIDPRPRTDPLINVYDKDEFIRRIKKELNLK